MKYHTCYYGLVSIAFTLMTVTNLSISSALTRQNEPMGEGIVKPAPTRPPVPSSKGPAVNIEAMAKPVAPPPLGPPAPTDPKKDMSIYGFLTPLVKGHVGKALTDVNALIAKRTDIRAQISLRDFKVWSPWLDATQYADRPNERFVRVPYLMMFHAHNIQKNTSGGWVGVPGERDISQAIDMLTFCNNWQTGQGRLKVVSNIQRPYLEDNQGALEEVVNFFVNNTLTSYIDNEVRKQLTQPPDISVDLLGQCDALGAYAGLTTDPTDDIVQYSYHQKLTKVAGIAAATGLEQITIKLLSLKRLAAHNLQGAVLYQPVEAPALEFYANYQHAYAPLSPLQEGQQLTLNVPPLMLNRPEGSNLLVLISNIIQNVSIGSQPTDSAFRVFDKATNFGNGIQTIRIQKPYWVQGNPMTGGKPSKVYVDAYELTLQVNAPQVMGPQTTTTPGTTSLPAQTGPVLRRGIEGEQPAPSPTVPEEKGK